MGYSTGSVVLFVLIVLLIFRNIHRAFALMLDNSLQNGHNTQSPFIAKEYSLASTQMQTLGVSGPLK